MQRFLYIVVKIGPDMAEITLLHAHTMNKLSRGGTGNWTVNNRVAVV